MPMVISVSYLLLNENSRLQSNSDGYENIRDSFILRNSIKNGIRLFHSGKCISEIYENIRESIFSRNSVKKGIRQVHIWKCIIEHYENIRESLFSRNSVKNGIRHVHSGKVHFWALPKISEKAYFQGILSRMGFDRFIVESAFLREIGKYQRKLIYEEFCQKWDSTGP